MPRNAKIDHDKLDHELLRKQMMDRKSFLAPVIQIHPNPWNQNKMGTQYYQALKSGLANPNIGFHTPITVRPHAANKGEWEIVDGEHRWKAATELGYKEIPCINLADLKPGIAEFITIQSNDVHGETRDEDKKAILQRAEQAMEEWAEEDGGALDVWAMTVMDEPLEDSSKYDLDDDDLGGEKMETTGVNMFFNADQLELWRRITGQLRLAHGVTQEEAAIQIVEHFEECTGMGVKTGDESLDQKQTDLVP